MKIFAHFFSISIRRSSEFDFRSGTRMVVRRPDGLGTARVRTTQVGATHPVSTGPISEIDIKNDPGLVRPHSTVQRVHSTVIPRGAKMKVRYAVYKF